MEAKSTLTEPEIVLSNNQLQEQLEQHKTLASVIVRIRESLELETIFKITVKEVRQLLQADRVAIFQFDHQKNWEGEFVAEDVADQWASALAAKVYDHCFGEQFAADYQQGKVQAVADIYVDELSSCHREILSRFNVRANLIVPLLRNQELWGLICIHQCSQPRQWQNAEIEFIRQIADHLTIAIQQASHLQEVQLQATKLAQTAQRDQVIAQIVDQIRPSLDIDSIFKSTTQEIRQLLEADRVAIFRFNPDWSGEFVAESFVEGWTPLVNVQPVINDTYLQQTQGGRYAHNQTFSANDIYQAGLTNCHVILLEQFQAKAFATAPIIQGEKLWGIIAAYQNSTPRQWQPYEIESLSKIGTQIGVALRHYELLAKANAQAEQQKTLTSVITRIRKSLDLETIFQTTVTEVRQMLQADRVAIFKFDLQKDWEGEFISEDVTAGWESVVAAKVYDYCFGEQFAVHYQQGRVQAVADIYDAGLSPCHTKILGNFQVRANLIVPLLKQGKLWGLLCVHQCDKPRNWQPSEIEFVSQIAENLGVALQHNKLLNEARYQANQQKTLTSIITRIRESLDLDTIFQTSVTEVRQLLQADRVGVFRFDQQKNWEGEFIYDDVSHSYPSAVADKVYDHCFGENFAPLYAQGRVNAITDIYQGNFPSCYVEILEKFQVRANLVAPLLQEGTLWGLLCIHQCKNPRQWQHSEIEFVSQIAEQLGVALKQDSYLKKVQTQAIQLAEANEREKSMERQKLLAETIDKIRQSLDVKTIFKTTTQAVRELLKVERVAIYRFNADWSGKFVADSFKDGWKPLTQVNPLVLATFEDTDEDDKLPRNETFVPIRQGERLWGLLVAYQNSQPRYWKDEEINLLAQVGVQLGVAIQQAELLEQTKRQTLELTQTLCELKQTQARLIQGEKMAGLGQLLAGVAHEINNPVSFIFGNLIHLNEYTQELMNVLQIYRQYNSSLPNIKEKIDQQNLEFIIEDLPKTLDSMKVGAERIREIVLSLRNFSRTDEADLRAVNIHEGLDSTLLILGHRLKENRARPQIEVVKEYGTLPLVECYPAQLNQVFMNLLSNGIDALEDKFKVIWNQHLQASTNCPRVPLKIWISTQKSDRQVIIKIADNGLGIPEDVTSHIFDPFFTTKEPGKGTGLGLSISHQIIVEKHQGQIKCTSTPGKGTEFFIELPCSHD
ncbi:GAF domain-containing protein [Nostoc sp. FACHB-87]|uniref:GAF domain-containing sensor histidine kinase n=1 Tax=Nostocaceae TaxID=1162 RepID=UPI001686D7A4|nr:MULTISPECIES: GAF domain-containing protein [Nostocaceae]MBD2301011.1 GAF domain-containing protein [Nostoc sp. FACHB-190]MBD2452558.1 GAF domain-containing protein [Nostoc sp. FACHB-87]MBD2473489.1 GAF domain-containing protein [Anabaena sp. FACHB-83]